MAKRNAVLLCVVLLAAAMPLWPQAPSSALSQGDEQLSFIGMKIDDLFKRFGSPQTVHAARGGEHWQDDVVFVYGEGDFYIYKDRVWQIGIKSIYGMKVGDVKGVATLVLGENAQDKGDYMVCSLPAAAWPLSIRVNINAGKITAIFIYRPDY